MNSPLSTDNAEVRAELRMWVIRNRWTADNVTVAMRKVGTSTVPSVSKLRDFCANKISLHEYYLTAIHSFLRQYPNPGDFDPFFANIVDMRLKQIDRQHDELLARRLEREREIAERRRWWLSQEGKPKRVERDSLFGLDKATILALSGGVRT